MEELAAWKLHCAPPEIADARSYADVGLISEHGPADGTSAAAKVKGLRHVPLLPFATCHGQPLEVSGGLAGMLLEPQRPPLPEVLCGLGFHLLAVGGLSALRSAAIPAVV